MFRNRPLRHRRVDRNRRKAPRRAAVAAAAAAAATAAAATATATAGAVSVGGQRRALCGGVGQAAEEGDLAAVGRQLLQLPLAEPPAAVQLLDELTPLLRTDDAAPPPTATHTQPVRT